MCMGALNLVINIEMLFCFCCLFFIVFSFLFFFFFFGGGEGGLLAILSRAICLTKPSKEISQGVIIYSPKKIRK